MTKWTLRTGLLLSLLAGAAPAPAQTVLTPPPAISTTPPALQEFRASEAGVLPPAEEATGISLGTLPFQWGPVNLRPHLFYSLSYADGLLSNPGQPESTIINQFSPGMLFVIGSHWTLDYTPTLRWYSNDKFSDGVDHSVNLNGWTAYEDWTFGLSQAYASFSAPLAQTGTQTDQESFRTGLNAAYRFNSKVSADFGLNQDFESAQDFQSYHQWSTMDWVNYQFWPRFNAGLGVGAGYVDVDTGADATFEQFQGRIGWRATDKTSLLVHGGLEYRQFLSGGASPLLNPVFGLALQSQLTKTTTLSVTADGGVSASYFENQTSESTSVNVDLTQAVSAKLILSMGGTFGTTSYTSSATGAPAASGYDYTSFRTRLSYMIIKRGSVAVSYQYNNNSSAEPGLSFTSNQVSLELSYSY
jgi:hypothetical protein